MCWNFFSSLIFTVAHQLEMSLKCPLTSSPTVSMIIEKEKQVKMKTVSRQGPSKLLDAARV